MHEPAKINRRDVLRTGGFLAGMLGIDPEQVLTQLTASAPMEKLSGLIALKDKVEQAKTLRSASLFDFFHFSDQPAAENDQAQAERVLHFLATTEDRQALIDKISDAYLQRFQAIEQVSDFSEKVENGINAFLSGSEPLAVELRNISCDIAAEVRERFLREQNEVISRLPGKRRKEPKEQLEKFLKQCPARPTLDELQDSVYSVYYALSEQGMKLHELIDRLLKNPVSKNTIDTRIDAAIANSPLAQSDIETRQRVHDYLHSPAFWTACSDTASSGMWMALDHNFDHPLYRAIAKGVGKDSARASSIMDKLLGDPYSGQKKFQIEILSEVIKRNVLSPAYHAQLHNMMDLFRRMGGLDVIDNDRGQEKKPSEKCHKASQNGETKSLPFISEDTLTVIDAMRRPGEFGLERSWFEKLRVDRKVPASRFSSK
jgi:hypothetical protein